MPKPTIAGLKMELDSSNKTIMRLMDDIYKLQREIEAYHKGQNTVPKKDYDAIVKQFESLELHKKQYERLYDDERSKRANERMELLNIIDGLKRNNCTNERSAGRKAFNDTETINYIKQLREQGLSLKSIADKLNSEEIKTRNGGTWAKSSVKLILDRSK